MVEVAVDAVAPARRRAVVVVVRVLLLQAAVVDVLHQHLAAEAVADVRN